MKKLKMTTQKLTFSEGCNKYLEYCRQRNLREDTINHYRQSKNHAPLQIRAKGKRFHYLKDNESVFII